MTSTGMRVNIPTKISFRRAVLSTILLSPIGLKVYFQTTPEFDPEHR